MIIKLPLPDGKQPLIKEGDIVDFDTPLIKVVEKKNIKIPIAQELDIPAKNIFLSMTKNVGEKIEQGEVLAKKKALFSEKTYVSDYTGIVKEIDHQEGAVTLSVTEKGGEKINSFFKGKVNKVDDDTIELEVQEAEKFELKESSSFFGGEAILIDDKSLGHFKEEISNKIVLIKKIEKYNQLKLEVIGATGYISLEPLSREIDIPSATLLKKEDWDKIKKLNLPYVSVIKKDNTIYFYR